jgi:hypothetical protein
MKMSAILIAAIALGATAPVVAAQRGNPDQPTISYDAKHDRYCVSQMITGNYLPVKDCRTKQDWAKAGLTVGQQPDAPKLASK